METLNLPSAKDTGGDEEDKEISCLKEQLKLMKEENVRLETLNDEKQKKLWPK